MYLKTKRFYQSPSLETEPFEADALICISPGNEDEPGNTSGDFWNFLDNERDF